MQWNIGILLLILINIKVLKCFVELYKISLMTLSCDISFF